MKTQPLSLLLGLCILAGCSPAAPVFPATPTALTFVPAAAADIRTMQNIALETTDSIAAPAGDSERCSADVTQAVRHEVSAEIDYAAHTVEVAQRTTFANRTNTPLAEIVFMIEPNRLPGAFTLDGVAVMGVDMEAELAGRRLTIALPAPLMPGCERAIDLSFHLDVPAVGQGVNGNYGYFGYTARQFNLGHWLPTIAALRAGEWVTHDAIGIGEQMVAEVADWYLNLRLVNTPEGLTVAAPGLVLQTGDQVQITLRHTREIALSLSAEFNRLQQRSANGITVELYTFGDTLVSDASGAIVDGAAQALDDAAQALDLYSDLFGDYPEERFVVVEGDFTDGMEFSGIVFVSDDWFRTYPGTPAGYLTLITIHETAHQWWYARVGSDQATTPWLDEALATYSEFVYLEEFEPQLKDWWWQFRVRVYLSDPYQGAPVNSPIIVFGSSREYINAVYLRGALMMDALRDDLGTEAFFDWLRRYAELGAGRIMDSNQLWELLTPEQLAATLTTRQAYLSGGG